jgi:translation initiation factor IF-2
VRSGKQLGEGIVGTLQRERKAVKEIHAGFECGFTTDGFSEWQEGDTVMCYAKVKAE